LFGTAETYAEVILWLAPLHEKAERLSSHFNLWIG
jgi:hypothetical protein